MNFESLVQNINTVHESLQAHVAHAINLALTARNWLIGYYIVEFEQHGEDRAVYGEKLLKKLESRIMGKGMNERRFKHESYSLRAVALRQLPSGSGRRDVERASVDDRCIKAT